MPSTYNLALPDAGVAAEVTPRVKATRFGDGYSQEVPDGINNVDEKWNLTWSNRTKAEIQAITAFLGGQGGAGYFLWVAPDGETKKIRCKRWNPVFHNGQDCSLTAVFERVYAL